MGTAQKLQPEKDSKYANAVHVVMGPKGGVGKSVVSSFLAQYLMESGAPLCFDTDPSNHSLAKVKALPVQAVNLLKDGLINARNYDEIVEKIVLHDGPAVIDTGTSDFHEWWNYAIRHGLFSVLGDVGHPVILHTPIASGDMLDDTLRGFGLICAEAPDESVVVWLNQRSRVELNGTPFVDLPIARQNTGKLLGVVYTEKQLYGPIRDTISAMINSGMTFAEAESAFNVMDRLRVTVVRSEIYEALRGIGI